MALGRTSTVAFVVGALAAVAGVATGLTGCFGGGAFACSDSAQCGAGGTCEPNGLCSFNDPTCQSGRRYGEAAGDLNGVCVGDEPPDAPPADTDGSTTTIDAASPTDAACLVDGLDVCALGTPAPALTFATETIDTDDDPRCLDVDQPSGGDRLCVVFASAITLPAGVTVSVTGDAPLALVSAGALTIDGVLDAGSTSGRDGPNSDPGGCSAFATAPENDAGGAGGGAGASFGGAGGDGGVGDTDQSFGSPGNGAAGTHGAALASPAVVRGGCTGQTGGDEQGTGGNNGQGGDGGRGGGAVWLVARGQVTVSASGAVLAYGEGGEGGESQSGGGGGGSGGLVRVGAPTITIAGTIAATGGGGGGGGANISGNDVNGSDGGDGQPSGAGGSGGQGATQTVTLGGNGGNGGGTPGDGTVGGSVICGAGGGGGGSGFVVLSGAATVSGTVSPAP
jgi:hypothetical protein